MRWLWAALVAVVAAGAAALWWPEHDEARGRSPAVETEAARAHVRSNGTEVLHEPAPPSSAHAPDPSRPERQPDGTIRLDGRFSISGSGSEQDPFIVTWPLLASAAESIDPSAGRLKPPAHVSFLAGQWVQISAYLAPPIWGESTSELLVMKNRWDGCCIGLPPTPFDCVEATLARPITLGARHGISYGAVRGRLVVEPFTAGAFLIGLYRLEAAQVADMKAQ